MSMFLDGIMVFVSSKFGKKFIEPPPFDLKVLMNFYIVFSVFYLKSRPCVHENMFAGEL